MEASHVKAKALRLIGIANELLALARQIGPEEGEMQLAGRSGTAERPTLSSQRDHPLWADAAREQYRDRRRRDKIFGNEALFGEPAWDILLDLFIAAKEGRRVSVMSACIGAAVPSTTALRWISALEREGLLVREDDPVDARRTYVSLSSRGYAAMVDYFENAARPSRPASLTRSSELDWNPATALPAGDALSLAVLSASRMGGHDAVDRPSAAA